MIGRNSSKKAAGSVPTGSIQGNNDTNLSSLVTLGESNKATAHEIRNSLPYSYPSLVLEKTEIAKVCHEISTNYGKYKNRKLLMHRARDLDGYWCIYYIENRGYGDYNSIEKYYD